MDRAWIGIDPGLSGAVAVIYPDGSAAVEDIPSVVVKATRRDYLAAEFAQLFTDMLDEPGLRVNAIIETPIAMPRQASNTTLKQGMGFGLAYGICTGLGYPVDLVAPATWKRRMGLPSGAAKGASRVMAGQLFPALVGDLKRVKDDGRAEALLLAEYRRRLG